MEATQKIDTTFYLVREFYSPEHERFTLLLKLFQDIIFSLQAETNVTITRVSLYI